MIYGIKRRPEYALKREIAQPIHQYYYEKPADMSLDQFLIQWMAASGQLLGAKTRLGDTFPKKC